MSDGKLQKLLDISEIAALKARYCEFTDLTSTDPATAAARLAQVFTEDVTGDYGELGLFKGRSAVLDFLVKKIGGTTNWMWHAIHSPQIAVTGDAATGQWTLVARLIWTSAPDKTETLIGRYKDEFRRTPAGWLISSLRWIAEG